MAGGPSLAHALSTLSPSGRIVVDGMASGTTGTLPDDAVTQWLYSPSLPQSVSNFNLGLYFALRPEVAVAALTRLISWAASGELILEVTQTFPLAEAATAHRLMESRTTKRHARPLSLDLCAERP